MENVVKPKLKTKQSQAPLVWQSKYEFVIPYNMDECIRCINKLGAKYWNENQELWRVFFPQPEFGIDSQEDNGGVFNFKMSGSQSRIALKAQLLGNLTYESNYQTRVKIQTGFTRSSIIGLMVILPIFSVVFLLMTHAANSLEIVIAFGFSIAFFSFIASIDLVFGHSLKSQLYSDLREALSAPKVPRPQTLPP